MFKDLMELVDDCPISEASVLGTKGEEVISEYRKLGFTKATEETYQKNLDVSKRQKIYAFEYRVITTEAIRKFLQRKVALYDKKHKPKPKPKQKPEFPSLDSLRETMRDLLTKGHFVHTESVEPPEPLPSEVFDTEALDRMREQLMRSANVSSCLMGMSENLNSAQEQIQIHRERLLREVQERNLINAMNQIHENADPVWCYPREGQLQTNNTISPVYEKTCDYDKLDPKTIGRFEWKEERVEDYDGLPPVAVLETFKEHKAREVFDYFTIASVNSIPDPLLLGRIDGDDDNRWFIDNWGTDVCLDDLI